MLRKRKNKRENELFEFECFENIKEKQEENNIVKKYDTIFPLIFFKNDEKIHKESWENIFTSTIPYSLDYSSLV